MNLESLINDIGQMYAANATLLKVSERLSASKVPAVRALAYEIAIAVSSMTAAAKPLIKEAEEVAPEVGGMAD